MRIITGLLKGRKITIPGNLDVRPTTDRVKEGLFSVIESRRFIQNCTVLDLYAGSGNLGFEALSRGAQSALFVDSNNHATNHIDKTARAFDMQNQATTATIDVAYYLQGPATPFDLIFADPPYTNRDIEETVQLIIEGGWLAGNGWLIFEHNKHHDFRAHDHLLFEKKYGRTLVSFFQGQPVTSTEKNG
jgi:16S rRNA (guanine(966)-N(2))-methyltransferase RsmD